MRNALAYEQALRYKKWMRDAVQDQLPDCGEEAPNSDPSPNGFALEPGWEYQEP